MRTVLRPARKRKLAGKDSAFTIRGRPFELPTAEHYFRRRTKALASGPEFQTNDEESTDVRRMTSMRVPDEVLPLMQAPQDLPELHHLERILVNIPRATEACVVFASSSGRVQPARRYLDVGMGVRYWFTQRCIRSGFPAPLDWQVLDRFCELTHLELKACKIGLIVNVFNIARLEHSWERPELVYQYFEYCFKMARILLGQTLPFTQILFAIFAMQAMLRVTRGRVFGNTKGVVKQATECAWLALLTPDSILRNPTDHLLPTW